MGTLVEINLHREFDFEDGRTMDYRIADVEVDCKFSQSPRGWQIPLEAVGHLCLLLWADDELGLCSGGLIRIADDVLRPGGNRDQKRTLNDTGLQRVRRSVARASAAGEPAPPPRRARPQRDPLRPPASAAASDGSTSSSAASRDDSSAARRVLTVGQQDDAPKRVRDARLRLRPEGIVVLGHQGDHPRIARSLGLPVPAKGQWVSARIVPREPGRDVPYVTIRHTEYRLALPEDPREPAPLLDSLREEA